MFFTYRPEMLLAEVNSMNFNYGKTSCKSTIMVVDLHNDESLSVLL